MSLFEAIEEANHRAVAGDAKAGVHPDDFRERCRSWPWRCIDPRLNPLIPEALGVREEDFIWLRNAGNIITGPLSSTLRSLALACAVKGGKRSRLSATPIAWWPKQLSCSSGSVPRPGSGTRPFPDNLQEFFGLFASERQNVMKAAEIVRRSPHRTQDPSARAALGHRDGQTGGSSTVIKRSAPSGTGPSDQRGTLVQPHQP